MKAPGMPVLRVANMMPLARTTTLPASTFRRSSRSSNQCLACATLARARSNQGEQEDLRHSAACRRSRDERTPDAEPDRRLAQGSPRAGRLVTALCRETAREGGEARWSPRTKVQR